jgi:hypothetical protein
LYQDKWGNPIIVTNHTESELDDSTDSDGEQGNQATSPEDADLEKLLAMAVEEDLPVGTVKPESSIPLSLSLGSALKRAPDGSVIGPRVVVRAAKVKVSHLTAGLFVLLLIGLKHRPPECLEQKRDC